VQAILVSHTHWDREWYRTFEDFRARLVDLVERVVELCEADPGYRFLLDGQTVVLEDFLEVRPGARDALRALCAAGRIAIGPWYVQPDSLLPSGEAHVRNLLLGRSVGGVFGPVSRVGYTPDSFGHPAQFPQLLRGFGIESFVYWRGNGSEIDTLPNEYDWQAPDGSRVLACHLRKGYFAAATVPDDEIARAAAVIAGRARELAEHARAGVVLLPGGIDHAMPEARTAELAHEIAASADMPVRRGMLEDYVAVALAGATGRPVHRGELVGARVAPLLPGVWSTRTWIKLANRRCEAELEGWAEPFAALALAAGLADERPALELAWKSLLRNQAHDSICGCSRDEVHEQMRARFDTARELAEQTAKRSLERLGGLGRERQSPWSDGFDLLVANPSPRSRTDVVRFPLDFHPFMRPALDPAEAVHPLLLHDIAERSFVVDGAPARLVPAGPGRLKLLPERAAFDLEFVARDVPAFGLQRVRVAPAPAGVDARDRVETVEPGGPDATIESGDVRVAVRADGRFDLTIGAARFRGLGELESVGDRGDSYDHDPLVGDGATEPRLEAVGVERSRHRSGVQELRVVRHLRVPEALDATREARSPREVSFEVETLLRVVPGVARVDVDLRVENRARDHRLRMVFPVHGPVARFEAATTFDVAVRTPGPAEAGEVGGEGGGGPVQAMPATFVQQGFVHAGGLSVVAPGLPEAEVVAGEPARVAITLLRCVGALSRPDLRSRPGPAGPGTDVPGAQCPGTLRARLWLFAGLDPAAAREAELGLRAVVCGDEAVLPEGRPLLALAPAALLVSAFKPAHGGSGVVVRVANPTSLAREAALVVGFPFADVSAVRLDETTPPVSRDGDEAGRIERDGASLRFRVPARGLRTLRFDFGRGEYPARTQMGKRRSASCS